jgi:hypothetical protein
MENALMLRYPNRTFRSRGRIYGLQLRGPILIPASKKNPNETYGRANPNHRGLPTAER